MHRKFTFSAAATAALFALACGGQSERSPDPATPTGGAAAAAAADPALGKVLGIDPKIRTGTLPNGLRYYVLEHPKPEARAQLWLGVNAGSLQEDDDQRGLAHFVEHMAFNGTASFEKMQIVNYLESIGMKFGPDVNAYTSFDETVYQLQVPTDDPAIVSKGFTILREWAGKVSFDPEEVEKERGVVLEEWRLGRGAWKRLLDKQYPVLFQGSRYAARLPIGEPSILEKAPVETLRRYYRDWYRPDLMAVVAVGDFDGAAVEAEIKAVFGDLEKPATPRPRVAGPVPSHENTLVTIETDPEMSQTQLQIYNKLPRRSERTVGDYRRFLAEQLYHTMLGDRLTEISRRPDAPFLFAYSATTGLVRTADTYVRGAVVKENRVEDALQILTTETERVQRHGFTATELERARKAVHRSYQQLAEERDKRGGEEFAAEILRNYFEGEMMPGIEAELEIVERYLPNIRLEELNVLAREWGGAADRVVMISGPDGMKKPTEARILALLDAADEQKIAPYRDEVSDAPLMASKPEAGKITAERTIEEIGVTEWTLSNGARVVVKPTDFKNDEVLISAFSPGGHSLVADSDFRSGAMAAAAVAAGGVGSLTRSQLEKRLAGKVVEIEPFIDELEEGLRGRASPRDLETALQLAHLRFVAPRSDARAFAAWKARTLESVKNRRLSPETAFFDDLSAAMASDHRRRRPLTAEAVAEVELEKAMSIYEQRFADASDFTFVIVGNVAPSRLKPLVETYLASLPASGRKERWRDIGLVRPRGVKTLELRRGNEPKSLVYLTFHGKDKWSDEAANDMQMLVEALQIRLREVMREDMGGVYFVAPSGMIARRPRQERQLGFFFSCDPKNVEALVGAIDTEIESIARRGIGDEYVSKIKVLRARQQETDLKENGWWQRQLATAYSFGDDPRKVRELDRWREKVSGARIKAAARRFADKKQRFLGVLYPEK